MESKYQRYNEEIINKISEALSIYHSASDAARDMGIDVSGLIKHIKKYRIIKETLEINKCSYKTTCQKKNEACDKCRNMSLYNQVKNALIVRLDAIRYAPVLLKHHIVLRLINGLMFVTSVLIERNAV